jgi:hypothetical protein
MDFCFHLLVVLQSFALLIITWIQLPSATQKNEGEVSMDLLPVAVEVVRNHSAAHSVYATLFRPNVSRLVKENLEASKGYEYKFPHLRITRKAFLPKNRERNFWVSIIPRGY